MNPYLQIVLLAPVAAALTLWMYGLRNRESRSLLLYVLRFISVWALLALLLNPKFTRTKIQEIKPVLYVLTDHSASMKETGAVSQAREIHKFLRNSKVLKDKFDVRYFGFDRKIYPEDSLLFDAPATDIAGALRSVEKIQKDSRNPVLLITDGRTTEGENYTYVQKNFPVFPVITGDTTHYTDLSIDRVNVNPYAYAGNRFPVEVFLSFQGNAKVQVPLRITGANGKTVFRKTLTFGPGTSSLRQRILLNATTPGIHHFRVIAGRTEREKNIKNNRKSFAVEVIDERNRILIVAGVYHPDIAALRRIIERRKQMKAEIVSPDKVPAGIRKYATVILYQPDDAFAGLFKRIEEQHMNTFTITGNHTRWEMLNRAQTYYTRETSGQKEACQAVFNQGFDKYVTSDPGLDELPPLYDAFGKISFRTSYTPLLKSRISGIDIDDPLLAVFDGNNDTKHAVLFGEGLWRWRLIYEAEHPGQQDFDDFWNRLFRYLQPGKKFKHFDLSYDKQLPKNKEQHLRIRYFDDNYQPIPGISPVLLLKKPGGSSEKIPLVEQEQSYRAGISGLSTGIYSFSITAGKDLPVARGSFEVEDFSVEQQFATADTRHLRQLATYTGGKVFYPGDVENWAEELASHPDFNTLRKEQKTENPLIDWYWLLALTVVSLSAEWFIRKYRGLI